MAEMFAGLPEQHQPSNLPQPAWWECPHCGRKGKVEDCNSRTVVEKLYQAHAIRDEKPRCDAPVNTFSVIGPLPYPLRPLHHLPPSA